MALFQKNPFSQSDSHALYSLGQEKTVLVVGLGNTGKEYDGTRHNVGFMCLDAFASNHEFDAWTHKKDLKCELALKTLGSTRVILCKPTTMMNLSGQAIQAVARFYKIPNNQIIVVHDELDIPFGQLRTRTGGGSAGHRGIKSVLEHIPDDVARLRIGIGAETPIDSADFVLAKFSSEETSHLSELSREVVSLLTEYVYSGQLSHETRSFLV